MNEEPTDLQIALCAADAGSAGHWPTVAAVLADEYRKTTDWQPIASAPKDGTEILVWHDDLSDLYHEGEGHLTPYGCWCEGGDRVRASGKYLAIFGGGFAEDESGEGWGPFTIMPDWWLKSDPSIDPPCPLAPTHWMSVTSQPPQP